MSHNRIPGALRMAVLAFASLGGVAASLPASLQFLTPPAEGRVAAERANRAAPTMRDNLQQRQRVAQSESLKQYFRGGSPRGWRGWKYHGKPTTVAAEQRRAAKRRNQRRHKVSVRGRRA